MRANILLTLASLVCLVASGLAAQAPTAPTTLFVDSDDAQAGSQGDPVNGINTKPYFSAIFNHDTPSALAAEARVQFATDAAFTNIVATSTWKAIAATAVGARIPDIQYTGSALDCVSQYFWRIRIKDALGIIGPWSTEAASFNTVACPHDATTLYVGNDEAQTGTQGDPVSNINMKPVFSAVMIHDSPTATAAEAKVQFATDAGFTNVVASSAWQAVTPVTTGNRSSDIEYNGTALACNTRYYWRIKFKDNVGVVGPWSTEPASFVTVHCPLEATTLFIGNTEAQTGTQGDPVNLINIQPYCSAIVTHSNPAATVVEAKVQFALDPAFTNKLGTSSWKSITPTTAGNRSSDIRYNGQAVPGSTRVYWRIRYRDSAGVVGHWSTEIASFETVPSPVEPTILFVDSANAQAGSQGNPTTGIDLDPVFSAIFNHNDTGGIASAARVEVAADAAFTNEVWISGWQSITATADGARIPDVAMPTGLLTNSTTYFWRVRIEDTSGNKGPWSTEPASFATSGGGGPVSISPDVSILPQGTTTNITFTKTGGTAFDTNSQFTFSASGVSVTSVQAVSANSITVSVVVNHLADAGAGTFSVMNGGAEVGSGSISVFYPHQRAANRRNGVVQDALLNPAIVGLGVVASTGEQLFEVTDVSLPQRMMELTFSRAYRSNLAYNGSVGRGWSSILDSRVTYSTSSDVLTFLSGDGRLHVLALAAGGLTGTGPYIEAGSYSEWGRDDNSTSGDASDDSITYLSAQGTQMLFSYGGLDESGNVVFRIASITDRNGNTMVAVRNADYQLVELRGDLYDAAEPNRHRLVFEYHTNGRLYRMLDFADFSAESAINATDIGSHTDNREWEFVYDSLGRLTEVKLPRTAAHGNDDPQASDARARARYVYGSGAEEALLKEVWNPREVHAETTASNGLPWLRIAYDGSGRVVHQDAGPDATTDTTHRTHVVYGTAKTDTVDALGRRVTVELTPEGRTLKEIVHTGFFDSALGTAGPKLRGTDPATFVTSYQYNTEGEIARVEMPRGNISVYHYDTANTSQRSRGNLLRSTLLPGTVLTTGLPPGQVNGILRTFTYTSTFNLIETSVDARAYDLQANYDITQPGQLLRDDSAEYTTTYVYNANGNLIQVTEPTITAGASPGSPNIGQQQTRTYTFNAFGQVTSMTDASVYPQGAVGLVTTYDYGTSGLDRGRLVATHVAPSSQNATTTIAYNSLGLPLHTTDIAGATTTTVRDQWLQVRRTLLPSLAHLGGHRYVQTARFDRNGNLVEAATEDPELNDQGSLAGPVRRYSTTWSHDNLGNALAETQEVVTGTFRTTSFVYDKAYQLREVHTPGGIKSATDYDERGNVFKTYSGLLATESNHANAITIRQVDYDLNGNAERGIDGLNRSRTSTYDAYDRLATRSDARIPVATVLHFAYDHSGHIVEERVEGKKTASSAGVLAQTTTRFDNKGRPYKMSKLAVEADGTTPLGYSSIESFDNHEPGWFTETISYLPDDRALYMWKDLVTNSTPETSTPFLAFEYDAMGRRTAQTDMIGNRGEWEFDAAGRVWMFSDHRVEQVSAALSTHTRVYTYDELGRDLTRSLDGDAAETYRQDALGRIVMSAVPEAGISRYDYDLAGRLVETRRISNAGVWTLSATGAVNKNATQTIRSKYEYDLDSNLTRTIDSAGNQTLHLYDVAGRLVRTTLPDGATSELRDSLATIGVAPGTTAYSLATGGYDAEGNLLSSYDEGGNRLVMTYDEENLLLTRSRETPAGQTPLEGEVSATFEYDGLGRVLQASNIDSLARSATRTEVWNSLSKLESSSLSGHSSESRTFGVDESARTYSYTRGTTVVEFDFDELDREIARRVRQGTTQLLAGGLAYHGRMHRRSVVTSDGDINCHFHRDQRGRMKRIEFRTRSGAETTRERQFDYSTTHGGMIGELEVTSEVTTPPNGDYTVPPPPGTPNSKRVWATRHEYDGLGRLTATAESVTMPKSGGSRADQWKPTPNTRGVATEYDQLGIPKERGIFYGTEAFDDNANAVVDVSHTQQAGDVDNPIPVGQGSRGIPDSIGNIPLKKRVGWGQQIVNDGLTQYGYDFAGRLVSKTRVSDGTVTERRLFDPMGIEADRELDWTLTAEADVAGGLATQLWFTDEASVNTDGGGVKFDSTQPNRASLRFWGDMKRSLDYNGRQGVERSYHDLLLDRTASGGTIGTIYFEDTQSPYRMAIQVDTSAVYLLDNGGSPVNPMQVRATGSISTPFGDLLALGVEIDLNANTSSSAIDYEVYANGSSILTASFSGFHNRWSPMVVSWESSADGGRMYRYQGYLDYTVEQNGQIPVVSAWQRSRTHGLMSASTGQGDTPDPTYQGTMDHVDQAIAEIERQQREIQEQFQAVSNRDAMVAAETGSEPLHSLVTQKMMNDATALLTELETKKNELLAYKQIAVSMKSEIEAMENAEFNFDFAYYHDNYQSALPSGEVYIGLSAGIQIQPVVVVEEGQPVTIPFSYQHAGCRQPVLLSTNEFGGQLPAGMLVQTLSDYGQGGDGEISWTPPVGTAYSVQHVVLILTTPKFLAASAPPLAVNIVSIHVTVPNEPGPFLSLSEAANGRSGDAMEIRLGQQVFLILSGIGDPGVVYNFSVTGAPASSITTLDASTAYFNWTPSNFGDHPVTLTVTSAHGQDSYSIVVRVMDEFAYTSRWHVAGRDGVLKASMETLGINQIADPPIIYHSATFGRELGLMGFQYGFFSYSVFAGGSEWIYSHVKIVPPGAVFDAVDVEWQPTYNWRQIHVMSAQQVMASLRNRERNILTSIEGLVDQSFESSRRAAAFSQSLANTHNYMLEAYAEGKRDLQNFISKYFGWSPIGAWAANGLIDWASKYHKRAIELHQSGIPWYRIAPDMFGLLLNEFSGMENLYRGSEERDLFTGQRISKAEAEFAAKMFVFEMLMNVVPGAGALAGVALGAGVKVAAKYAARQLAKNVFGKLAIRQLPKSNPARTTAEGGFASIQKGGRVFDGRVTHVSEQASSRTEFFGKFSPSNREQLNEFARNVYNRELPSDVNVYVVDAIRIEEGGNVRLIDGFVTQDRKKVFLTKQGLNNPNVLADELGHVLLPGIDPNKHHRIAFAALNDAAYWGKVSLSQQQAQELMGNMWSASLGN